MATQYHYRQFPPTMEINAQLQQKIALARTELGRYDGLLLSMHKSDILLSPLLTQESVLSSRIEGTQSSLSDVLAFEAKQDADMSPDEKNDIIEVLNYRRALFESKDMLDKLPLSGRVLKNAHRILMDGARGHNKQPGEYRRTPVWIGPDKTDRDKARFIPIDAQHIDSAMSDWEHYLHNDHTHDDILKIALLHAEFEAIHPFLDGNGRLGRMLVPLFLWQKKLLCHPSFYMSAYLEAHRQTYYDLLLDVSAHNRWEDWSVFFISGIIEQARDNRKRAEKIIAFYNRLKEEIPRMSRSPYGITALDFIFKTTFFRSTDFYQQSGVPATISKRLLDSFVQHKILVCRQGSGRKPNFYMFKTLINIADGK